MYGGVFKRITGVFIMIVIVISTFTGCFNYDDINKVTFSTSIIFDVDDLGQAVIYLDCIKPYRSTNESSDKGRRILYKGIGKTALEAIKDVSRVSSYKMNCSQTRAYIFTEKAARNGIKKFLDLINNNSEFQMKPSAFIYYGDVEDLIKTAAEDEEYLGLFLNDLVEKDRYNPKAVESNINTYLSERLMGGNASLLASIDLKEDALDKKIEINGASIFREDVLVERMSLEDSLIYNLMVGGAQTATLEVSNPQTEENFISLEVLDSWVKDSLEFVDGRFKLLKEINIDVSISEVEGALTIDTDALKYIKVNEEAYIEGYSQFIFEKYKNIDLDIFDIKRMVEIYTPKKIMDDPLSITDLEVTVNLSIKGTGSSKDSL